MLRSVRILHTSDIHLGRMAGLGQATAAHHRLIEQSFERVCRAASEQADVLLIVGDLLDKEAVFGTFVEKAVSILSAALGASPSLRVVIVAGNHDPAFLYQRPEWRLLAERIYVATEPGLIELEDLDLGIVALPWQAAKALTWRQWPSGMRLVAAAHTCFPPHPMESPQNCVLIPEEAASWPVSYVALGHYHDTKIHAVGNTRLVYSGAPEIMDLGHVGKGQALWVTVREDGSVDFEPFATGELTGLGSQAWQWTELAEPRVQSLEARLAEMADAQALLRVRVQGPRERPAALDLAGILGKMADRFFCLDLRDETTPVPDVEAAAQAGDFTVLGRFVRLAHEALAEAEKRATTADQDTQALSGTGAAEEAAILREALLLGCYLLGGREEGQ